MRLNDDKQCNFWFLTLYFKLATYIYVLYHLGFVLENSLHAKLVQSLVNLYEFISGQNNDESDDDILLPKNLENDLLLCLTKMRAHNYNIEVLENDSTLVLKARKQTLCHLTTAHLTTELVLYECQKLQQGLNCNNDWWLSEMAGLRIIKSKSEPSSRKVGNLKLCQWDNVRVVSKG